MARHSVEPEKAYGTLKQATLQLKAMGIKEIIYPCNTGHMHRERLYKETGTLIFCRVCNRYLIFSNLQVRV